MMHRCSGSQGNMVGPCSCGLYHTQTNPTSSSFSMLFSNNYKSYDEPDMYNPFPSSSSSVDCTLSLGTPSTRLTTAGGDDDDQKRIRHERRAGNSRVSNFCWDLLSGGKSNNNSNGYYPSHSHKRGSNGNGNGGGSSSSSNGNDPLLARRCANCDTTSTPLWRNGPRGPKSLCNACGIRFKKEERRATAANANNNVNVNGGAAAASGVMEQQQYGNNYHTNGSWGSSSSSTHQKMPCYSPANEFRFIEDNSDHHYHHHYQTSDSGIPFLSWRLNITDRPSLVHDFTR